MVGARDKMLEAVKLRAQDETWQPTRFSDGRQLEAFLEDMNDLGVGGLRDYVTGRINMVNSQTVLYYVTSHHP